MNLTETIAADHRYTEQIEAPMPPAPSGSLSGRREGDCFWLVEEPGCSFLLHDPEVMIIGATVAEDVAFGPENLGLPPQEIRKRVREALKAVGLEQFHDHATHLLSDSQKQRLIAAGAVAMAEPHTHPPSCCALRSASPFPPLEGEGTLDGASEDGPSARSLLKDLRLGQYLPGDSLLHRTDPRTKIVCTLLLMGAGYLCDSIQGLLFLFSMLLGISVAVGKPLRHSMRGLRLILSLSAVAVAVNLVTLDGAPIAGNGLFSHISVEAVVASVEMLFRISLLATAASLVTFTTTPLALADGLERLLRPLSFLKVPVSDLSMMLLIAQRFIPLIVDEAEKLLRSHPAHFRAGGLLHKSKSLVPFLAALFAAVARRGDALATAMEGRGFRGSAGRTRMNPLRFGKADLATVLMISAVLSITALVEMLPRP